MVAQLFVLQEYSVRIHDRTGPIALHSTRNTGRRSPLWLLISPGSRLEQMKLAVSGHVHVGNEIRTRETQEPCETRMSGSTGEKNPRKKKKENPIAASKSEKAVGDQRPSFCTQQVMGPSRKILQEPHICRALSTLDENAAQSGDATKREEMNQE